MNKNLIIAGVVALLVVLGVGAFVMSKNSSNNPSSGNPSNESTTGEGNSQKSIKDLLTGGSAQQCTFTDKVAEADASGTVYVANGRMRGDFDSQSNGQAYKSHMIIKDNTSYTWADGQTTGMMMEFDPNKMADQTETSEDTSQSVDVNKYVDYNCSSWSVDESVFTPPANVKFQSMGDVMTAPTSGAGGSQTSPQSNCAMCNYLSGDAKTQCLAELSCN